MQGNWLTRINYMRSAKYWILFSLVLTLAGTIALFTMGLNKGVDFTGGFVFDVQFEEKVEANKLRDLAQKVVNGDVQTQQAEIKGEAGPNAVEYFLRTPELKPEVRSQLLKEMESLGKYKIVGEDNVSGAVSKELTQNALMAISIAAALQLIYIWFRFEFKFGVTAVAAIVHDAVVVLGLIAIFRVQINSAFVAAILTVLGYSMNDTVVVIDRIRENLAKRRKGEDLTDLTTRSIQEVITRSLYTGVSVQVMLICLLVFGGDTLWDFAMTLLIGVTSGTYSSIFIASALWLFWHQWEDNRKKAAPKAKPAKA